jgi:glycosyltransferase involved in cell wall biosynthesis
MDLSIVIPVYNERLKIAGDVVAAAIFLRKRRIKGEVIVVDDGSADGTAEEARRAGVSERAPLSVVRLERHRGKGAAVRAGILKARGKIALFIDSGLCIPYGDLAAGIEWIRGGECEIAHASRRLAESVIIRPPKRTRRLSSWLFRQFVFRAFNLPVELTDTQVGCKIYDGRIARELYGACRSEGFAFDVEIILRAVRDRCRIREFPVHWTSDPDTRLSLLRTAGKMVMELSALKFQAVS